MTPSNWAPAPRFVTIAVDTRLRFTARGQTTWIRATPQQVRQAPMVPGVELMTHLTKQVLKTGQKGTVEPRNPPTATKDQGQGSARPSESTK